MLAWLFGTASFDRQVAEERAAIMQQVKNTLELNAAWDKRPDKCLTDPEDVERVNRWAPGLRDIKLKEMCSHRALYEVHNEILRMGLFVRTAVMLDGTHMVVDTNVIPEHRIARTAQETVDFRMQFARDEKDAPWKTGGPKKKDWGFEVFRAT